MELLGFKISRYGVIQTTTKFAVFVCWIGVKSGGLVEINKNLYM